MARTSDIKLEFILISLYYKRPLSYFYVHYILDILFLEKKYMIISIGSLRIQGTKLVQLYSIMINDYIRKSMIGTALMCFFFCLLGVGISR